MTVNNIIETGTYTGNSSTQSITIGWRPAFIMIVEDRTSGPGGSRAMSFKFASQSSSTFCECSTEAINTSTGVTITSTGFDLGSDDVVNDDTYTYHYVAIREGPWIDTGTYTGTAGSTQTITTGRQPNYLFLCGPGAGSDRMHWKHELDSTNSNIFVSVAVLNPSNEMPLTSTGFTAGGNANTNTNTYHWCAIYNTTGSNCHFETGTWTGDDSSPQTVTTGRQPKFVFGCGITNNFEEVFLSTDTMTTDEEGVVTTGYSYDTGGITHAATGFTVGSAHNADPNVYRYLAGYY